MALFLFLLLSLISFPLSSTEQACSSYAFSSSPEPFTSCVDLPHLNSSLHWSRSQSSAVCIAYRAPQSPNGWIAWGVNPNSSSMVGTHALVAFHHSNGSMVAYPTILDSYSPSLKPQKLGFPVYNVSAEYVKGDMVIYATVGLIGAGEGDAAAKFNQVWQEGSRVVDGVPAMHSVSGDNVLSKGSIELK
ncbi:uncharacterized protein A4U43_C05F30510 [Asparagus officinalis]|uniref:DOMON domain-containing protein n=1 Tax=Asparagus officinalis TaxID=4686 RepID=A0A5P1EWA1_ASPOF|nr:cytochrome b561 and DOMON domain-containing protein At5g47530-like [Asparagus officinalis]ONK70124.1 uncharacterized protein A4U43_C05F30510 [Asparagus officinalis]